MGGASALVLISIAAGYLFCSRYYLFRYSVARQAGHKLYLSSATVGFAFLIVVHLAYLAQDWLWSLTGLPYLYVAKHDEYFFVISIITFFASLISCDLYNKLRPSAKAVNLLKAWEKNDFESICAYAQETFKLISISLDTRKVYVGYIYDSLEPDRSESHLTIIPIFSGYRDETTLEFVLTNTYGSIIDLMEDPELGRDELEIIRDCCITTSRERIVTINIFNPILYEELNNEED